MGANPPDPTQKAYLSEAWQTQFNRFEDYAIADWKGLKLEEGLYWYMPQRDAGQGEWSGRLFDIEGISQCYSRKEHRETFVDCVKGGKASGRVGDLMVTELQGDWLAAAERAFRARHHTLIRAMTHANARRFGHQHGSGVLLGGQKSYLDWIIRQTGSDMPDAVPTNSESVPPWAPPDETWRTA
jgi:hypothetical protein